MSKSRKKVWRVGKLLLNWRDKRDVVRTLRGGKRGTCLADCFSLISERKGGDHAELIRRYYQGNGGLSWATERSNRLQLSAYFRKRGYLVYGDDKRGPRSPQYFIIGGPVKDGEGSHAVIAKGSRIKFNPATWEGNNNLKYAEEFIWLVPWPPRKKSRDHHPTKQQHRMR